MIVNQDNVQKARVVDEEDLVRDNVEMVRKIVREEETVVTVDHVVKIVNNASTVIVVNAKTNKETINKRIIRRKVKKTDHDQNKETTEKKEKIVKFIEKLFEIY